MNQFKKQVTFLLCLLLASFFSYGQNSYPNTGDTDINNANIKISNIDTKGLLLYQTDKSRFGQIILNKDGGTGLGTPNTLLIEAGNGYGVDYGQRILFKTATLDRLVIEHDGNIGIGTSSPSEKLTIENGNFLIKDGNIQVDKLDGKGLLLYQTDKSRFGQIILNKDGGTGLGTPNTLLIEAGNSYGVNNGQRILFKTAGSDRLVIEHDGNVGIGTTDPKNKLSVNGAIWAQEVKVTLDDAADWVFEDDYELRSLVEVETFIKDNKHLPDVPSADEFRKNNMNIAEMNNVLLQKVEELTLYMIEMNKELKEVKTENKELAKEVRDLKGK